jgi:hypothetical protein
MAYFYQEFSGKLPDFDPESGSGKDQFATRKFEPDLSTQLPRKKTL